MESTKTKKKWLTMLLTAMMSITLLFGATACNDNNAGNNDVIVEDEPDIVVPDADPAPDVDLDVDVETPSPSPSAS